MSARRWLASIVGVVLIAAATTPYVLPELARRIAIAKIQTLTQRPVSIDRVDLNLLTGRGAVHGFRLAERDGRTPFADFRRLDFRLHLPSLVLGHLWLRDLVLTDSTVRVVRLPTGLFNLSDLIQRSESNGRPLDVTVDHFSLRGGTVTLEDRALPESRTWTSEQITIEASNVSTRRNDGRALARSVTAGAPVSVEMTGLRLYPIHLRATVTVEGLDITPAQIYFQPDAAVVIQGGRVSTSIAVSLDAREGLRADGTARLEDVAVMSRDGTQPVVLVPSLTTNVGGFAFQEGAGLRLAQLAVEGRLRVRDPRMTHGTAFQPSTLRATIADLTWPATTPGRLDVVMSVPGGGMLALTGAIQPPPAASELRLRLANLDLAPWTQFIPVAARVSGLAEADLRMHEPLAAGVPARVQGSIAVKRLALADGGRDLLGARRVEANGLVVHWPSRVVVDRVVLTGPRGTIDRDRTGAFPLKDLLARPGSSSAPTVPAIRDSPRPAAAVAFAVDVGAIVVRDGAIAWRDERVSPAARLEVSRITGQVTGIGWPLRGPAGLSIALRPPAGGQMQITGQVGLDPLSADVRVRARNADLAPYQPYLPTTARIAGSADLDVAVVVPSVSDGRATARGSAALARVNVRDGERTVMRVERAQATGVEVQWPERVVVGRLALAQPWIVIERDDKGVLTLRPLLSPPSPARPAGQDANGVSDDNGRATPVMTVTDLSVDGGGMRLVDRAVSPAFAVDFQPVALRVQGLSTASDRPARVDVRGRLGAGADVIIRGTLGALDGPLRLDLSGEVREFAVPRANPYVLQQAGWKTTEGRLTSTVHARVDGDSLSARTDIRVSRLQLVRAAPEDGAEARIGLPLNMLSALMKDRHGDIRLSFPVGGRLSDPRFDFREAIWSAIRTVTVKAITLPVSWVGRVRFASDSRIERIEVDPVAFEPGTSAPTAEGRAQVTRVAAFLDQLSTLRIGLTPVVSAHDVTEMKRRSVEASIDRAAREMRLSRDAAAARLFEQAFPGRPALDSLESTLGALVGREQLPTSAIAELARQRVDAVRSTVKEIGIDPERLAASDVVQREGDSRVELNVLPAETERPSKLRETLRRLGLGD